jgi:hypothetical protein
MAQNPRTILVAAEPGEERGRLEALVADHVLFAGSGDVTAIASQPAEALPPPWTRATHQPAGWCGVRTPTSSRCASRSAGSS